MFFFHEKGRQFLSIDSTFRLQRWPKLPQIVFKIYADMTIIVARLELSLARDLTLWSFWKEGKTFTFPRNRRSSQYTTMKCDIDRPRRYQRIPKCPPIRLNSLFSSSFKKCFTFLLCYSPGHSFLKFCVLHLGLITAINAKLLIVRLFDCLRCHINPCVLFYIYLSIYLSIYWKRVKIYKKL